MTVFFYEYLTYQQKVSENLLLFIRLNYNKKGI